MSTGLLPALAAAWQGRSPALPATHDGDGTAPPVPGTGGGAGVPAPGVGSGGERFLPEAGGGAAKFAPGGVADAARPRAVVARLPMHEQILPHLRLDIIQGRWPPGERLPEPLLCLEFGISRTPLRHAFKILESEGLLRLLPHVGAVVTEIEIPDLVEKLEMLIALEQWAAGRAAERQHPDTLQHLELLHARMLEPAAGADSDDYFALNDQFHRAIVLGAGNATLMRQHDVTMTHLHRVRHCVHVGGPLEPAAAENHGPVMAAIRAADADAAVRAMRQHLEVVAFVMLGWVQQRRARDAARRAE